MIRRQCCLDRAGFSLVEMAIVLVIIGLVIGGTMYGQNLIRASELKSIGIEAQTYKTKAVAFQNQYYALPGDLPNATDLWGSTAGCPGTAGTGTQTCNGNGNGQLDAAPAASQYGEVFMFWQHLANADMIDGSYSGIAGSGGTQHHVIRQNAPASSFGNAGWSVYFLPHGDTGDAEWFAAATNGWGGNLLMVGTESASGLTEGSFLKPEEAWSIDTKLDDGKPGRGSIGSLRDGNCTLATSATDVDAAYALQQEDENCRMIWPKAF